MTVQNHVTIIFNDQFCLLFLILGAFNLFYCNLCCKLIMLQMRPIGGVTRLQGHGLKSPSRYFLKEHTTNILVSCSKELSNRRKLFLFILGSFLLTNDINCKVDFSMCLQATSFETCLCNFLSNRCHFTFLRGRFLKTRLNENPWKQHHDNKC